MPINSGFNNTHDRGLPSIQRNEAIAVFVAVVILFCSVAIAAQTQPLFPPYQPPFDTAQQYTLPAPLIIGISAQANDQLNQSTRSEIYEYVQDNPGVHFRGICNGLGLSVGMVQYHVGILVSAGLLSTFTDVKMQRFFVLGKYSQRQMRIISLLRHGTTRQILRIINEQKTVMHSQLAAKLSISSQGLTWQMHRLQRTGVIQVTQDGLRLSYSINDADIQVVKELVDYN